MPLPSQPLRASRENVASNAHILYAESLSICVGESSRRFGKYSSTQTKQHNKLLKYLYLPRRLAIQAGRHQQPEYIAAVWYWRGESAQARDIDSLYL